VGQAAIQLAKTRDCEIFGLASESKHGFLKSQGCQHALSSADYVNEVRKLTNGRGVDLILDPVGGKTWTESYELLAPAGPPRSFWSVGGGFGQEAQLGARSGPAVSHQKVEPANADGRQQNHLGLQYGSPFCEARSTGGAVSSLVGMYEAGQIKPHVDRTFSRFAEAAAAHHYIHDRKAKGKVLLIP